MKLVECVPNFSEGRDLAVIEAISAAISEVDGVTLLDVDPGSTTNRTVVTFVGEIPAVEEAAFLAIERAAGLIDMRLHHGEHPRMGATDVCPFVPLESATMQDCIDLAHRVSARVGDELAIPVYLYGEAASSPERRSLADVRRGEYEGLADRHDAPDFGPGGFNVRSGATAIGARSFLIAYNVNLNTRDRSAANKIAAALRESGGVKKDEEGRTVRDATGVAVRVPGKFTELRGVGWYIEEYGRAQVSFNLTDPSVTPLHAVFDAAREEAERLGLRVTGSEIVGLVPRDSMLEAADHYLQARGATTGIPEAERMHIAAMSLGLSDVTPFDPAQKVIEYRYRGSPSGLVAMPVLDFADSLSSGTPTPGGGSAAALVAALSASLSSMIAALTFGKNRAPEMEATGSRAQELKDWFLQAVDRDTESFDALMTAFRTPRADPNRPTAITDATIGATIVPLEVLESCAETLRLAHHVASAGNASAVTDAGVAGLCALAAAEGASLNVRVNLSSLDGYDDLEQRRVAAIEICRTVAAEITAVVESRLPT